MGQMYNPEREQMPGDELDELVTTRLKNAMIYARENNEYWRDRFTEHYFVPEEIEEPSDAIALPPMDKEDFLATQPPESDEYEMFVLQDGESHNIDCTTGTTGREKMVATNDNDAALSQEAVRRGYAAAGVDDESVLANFLPKGLYMSGRQSEDAAEGYVKMHQAFGHTNTPPRDRVLSTFKDSDVAPDALFGAPSTMERMARELEDYGTNPEELGIESILLVGEAASPERQDAIAETYDAAVTNNYASTELGFTAYQSPECDEEGLHVTEDLSLVLVVNEEENRLAEPGEAGEVWVSTLYPPGEEGATPVFNYRQGDRARYRGRQDCGCGRTHKMITDVARSDNAVQTNNAKIFPHHVEDIIHKDHYRDVLTGEYEVKIGEEDGMDTINIRVDVADTDPAALNDAGVPDKFFTDEETFAYGAIADTIYEEFMHAHVAPKAFEEGDLMQIDVEVVETGELDLYDMPGKPPRIQVEGDGEA